jgi:hypothetical protein
MITLHHRPGSFSDRWLEYCRERGLRYQVVDAHGTQVMEQVRGASAFLWHWAHWDTVDQLHARQLIQAVEAQGIPVFPNNRTCWHFDDKIGQKYLLEGVGAPLVPTYVFFDEPSALDWIWQAEFPKVFKLRCGAGSTNVRLVKRRREAERCCRRAFGSGFAPVAGYLADFSSKLRRSGRPASLARKLIHAPEALMQVWRSRRVTPRQRGYVYFQDFLPNNQHDTRVTIIGDRAFAFRRGVRPGDFRASGSGLIDWAPAKIDLRCVDESFSIAQALGTQSLATDYVTDEDGNPRILEMSYGFVPELVYQCPGWWDVERSWHEGHVWPQDAIIEDLLRKDGVS